MTSDRATSPSLWDSVRPLLFFAAATTLVAYLGSLATTGAVNSEWFRDLEKPGFYPPDALFGTVWTILYVMIAVAGWLAWRNGGGLRTMIPWTTQLVLNLGWSVFFFGAQQPGWAMVVILALLGAIVWTIVAMWPISRSAAYLLISYLAWVAFATVLNGSILALN